MSATEREPNNDEIVIEDWYLSNLDVTDDWLSSDLEDTRKSDPEEGVY